jgi:hypothetical protein
MSEQPAIEAGDWPMIEGQLPPRWRELAVEHGLIKSKLPVHLGAKVTDVAVPLRLVLFHVGTNTSLKTTVATAAAAGIVAMSAVALHKWMRKMGAYLASLLVAKTEVHTTFAAERWAGYDIIIVDASSLSRPGSDGTTARVHYALRLTTLLPVQIEVTDDKGGETFRRFDAKPGELWMGDRGYANPPGIAAVTASKADVLVRFNRGSLPLYDVHGVRMDVPRKLAGLGKPGRVKGWAARVQPAGATAPIHGRLIAVRLPPEKAAEARARLRREQGSEVTAESIAMAEFVVVFTTVPKDRLSDERILELYGLRWQVELHIKRDKSIAGLDELPNFREDTVHSWICAKMLLTQIARAIPTANVAIPPCGDGGDVTAPTDRYTTAATGIRGNRIRRRDGTLAGVHSGVAGDLRRPATARPARSPARHRLLP